MRFSHKAIFRGRITGLLAECYQYLCYGRLLNAIFSTPVTVETPFPKIVLREMNIEVEIYNHKPRLISERSGLFVVCNHPTGIIDGIILIHYFQTLGFNVKILAREYLAGVEGFGDYVFGIPFELNKDTVKRHVEARERAIAHMAEGGVVVAFGSGFVSREIDGRFVDEKWTNTVATIAKAAPRVLPCYLSSPPSLLFRLCSKYSKAAQRAFQLFEVGFNF